MIDFLRGFSIITIVMMHLIQSYLHSCPGIISRRGAVGGSGVHVFLLCSGFGRYFSYKKKPFSFGGFIRKRNKPICLIFHILPALDIQR